MAGPKKAETAQEFFEKYKSKKFRADNAGLCIILEYLYQSYLVRYENKEELTERLYPSERYDAILAKGATSERERDRWLVYGMQGLMEWLPTIYDSAITVREAANMAIITATNNVTSSVFMMAKISEFYNHDPESLESNKADIIYDLSNYEKDIREQYEKTREYIKNSLCYINAYNTFINLLQEELKIPEILFFQISTETTENFLSYMNETGKRQYDALVKLASDFTEVVVYDEPIELVPAQIPEENLRRATGSIIWAIYHGGAWSSAFSEITEGYWRRNIYNG